MFRWTMCDRLQHQLEMATTTLMLIGKTIGIVGVIDDFMKIKRTRIYKYGGDVQIMAWMGELALG
ncbi:hypothetical protein ACLOJK_037182 [Asimina triloba]